MTTDVKKIWVNQTVHIYLSTPLMGDASKVPLAFAIKSKVLEVMGAGLFLEILEAYDQQHQVLEGKKKKIFLPFSKVDYISF